MKHTCAKAMASTVDVDHVLHILGHLHIFLDDNKWLLLFSCLISYRIHNNIQVIYKALCLYLAIFNPNTQ